MKCVCKIYMCACVNACMVVLIVEDIGYGKKQSISLGTICKYLPPCIIVVVLLFIFCFPLFNDYNY